jgi:hypothetical protein
MCQHDEVPDHPEPLALWRERGYTVAEARRWISANFTMDAADKWRRAGVYVPKSAHEWRTAGATPLSVDRWIRAGMTPRDAVRWREFGVSPDEAADRHLAGERPGFRRRWWRRRYRPMTTDRDTVPGEDALASLRLLLREGISPSVARVFVDVGWRGADAVGWAQRSIDPVDAKICRALGFTPDEAKRLLASTDAISLLTAWWTAGVPIGEVAAWCAAGFTAEEAQAFRLDSQSLEQAQILRALADGET